MSELSLKSLKRATDQPPTLDLPPLGASDTSRQSIENFGSLQMFGSNYGVSGTFASSQVGRSLEEKLFDALASFKIKTSQVAMHLTEETRNRLFHQIDDLLDAEEWDREDEIPTTDSFSTFLRMMLYWKWDRRPGIGITSNGHLLSAWSVAQDRLTVECLPADQIRWVLSCDTNGSRETAAGTTNIVRIMAVLEPYQPERWFNDGGS